MESASSQSASSSVLSSASQNTQLSLAIICLNEEALIERCIRSVPFATDVVVLDSGSTDRTREIATALGARVFNEDWRGFRAQKQRATDLCKNDWVLSLDADECLSESSIREMADLLSKSLVSDGYEIPRLSWTMGRWIRHGGWYPDLQLRLFNRTKATWQGGEHVHERVSAANVGRLREPIEHFPFENLAEQIATNNRYSGLGATELHSRGVRFSLAKIFWKPISKFLETYLLKRGFADGLPGFIISVGAAYSVFLKFAKLWELERSVSSSLRSKSKPPA
jgi:glycosyltransferase involved in cell wall biosynthesis